MSFITDNLLTILVASVVTLFYIVMKRKYNYFLERGLSFDRPSWKEIFLDSLSFNYFNDKPLELYRKLSSGDDAYVGFFGTFLKPFIVVLNPKTVEKILIKDFSHFQDHGFDLDIDNNPLAGHLLNMRGDKWRTLRHKLVPTFTSSKLKGMIPVMEECADILIREMKKDVTLRQDTNLKELYKKYSLAVIAACAFGIDPNSVQDPNSQFRRVLTAVIAPRTAMMIKFFFILWFPTITRFLKFKFFDKEVEDFFFSITKDSFEIRRKSGIKRNDFIQLLLELKEMGTVQVDAKDLEQDERECLESLQSQEPMTKLELTDELLAAQAFVFLVAGFENSAYLAAITNYTMIMHPEIQARVREEIKEAKNKFGGINYQSVKEMKLLGACIDESLRLYPPGPNLLRESTKTYTLDDGKKLEKGLSIMIPLKAMHMDERYWKNPEQFDPDRFLNDKIVPGTYLPFGDGPRICIAQRLALITNKVLMAKMIETFDLLPSDKMKEPMKIKYLFGVDADGGFIGNFSAL